jgi:phosphatidylglycerol:prolipoprotein diacylglycerol transferase
MLYEALLEGLVLFVLLQWFIEKPRPRMATSGLFLLLYGIFRFAVEFVRLPDAQIGYLAFGWLTMGQVLTLPMILFGIGLLVMAYRRLEAPA